MTQKTNTNIRLDREIKEKAQRMAAEQGTTLSNVINMFLLSYVETGELVYKKGKTEGSDIIQWDIYEVTTVETNIHGIMLRGRIRKYCLEKGENILLENTTDIENSIRFAVKSGRSVKEITAYITKLIPDSNIKLVEEKIPNPVLSKLKVNITSRYTIY